MGKGKGSFDHWASRIAVSKVIFEVKGNIHEQVVRDAFRIAGNKMPGMFCSSHSVLYLADDDNSQACTSSLRKETHLLLVSPS